MSDADPAWQPQGFDDLLRHRTPLRIGEVKVWFADLDAFSALLSDPADTAVLSEAERERASKMSAVPVRSNFLLSRILLRHILGAALDRAPKDLLFGETRHGKPFLCDATGQPLPNGIEFNLSHCRGAWLFGISLHTPIGVDVERARRVAFTQRLARRVFTVDECAALDLVSADLAEDSDIALRDAAFLTGWTRKEAVLKAIGSGFSESPREIEVSLSAAPKRLLLPPSSRRSAIVWSLRPPTGGFASVALVGDGADGFATLELPSVSTIWLSV